MAPSVFCLLSCLFGSLVVVRHFQVEVLRSLFRKCVQKRRVKATCFLRNIHDSRSQSTALSVLIALRSRGASLITLAYRI